MDEMRQLQRILTKLLPGSVIYMPNQDGGGNKVGTKGWLCAWLALLASCGYLQPCS